MVAVVRQQSTVPGKSVRITGDIDDPGGIQTAQLRKCFGSTAPGRVEDNRVERAPDGCKLIQPCDCIRADKFSICYAVYCPICLGSGNGTRVFLDARDSGHLTGYGQRKIAVAAVQVQYLLSILKAAHLPDNLQHGPVLFAVYLGET